MANGNAGAAGALFVPRQEFLADHFCGKLTSYGTVPGLLRVFTHALGANSTLLLLLLEPISVDNHRPPPLI
jgi:hypothetical protein